ncbi:MAG: sensor histidine kinase [Clostridiales bacterium]|nr:sensor histidine kinase [Clostridiales bacterium]
MKRLNLNNYKIRTKLLLIYCFCVLIPIIFTDATILYTVHKNYKDNRMTDLNYTMERVRSNLVDTVDSCMLFTYNLYTDEKLDEFISKEYVNHLDYYEDYTEMLKYNSLNYNYNYGRLYRILIYADNSTLVNGGSIARLDTVKDADWYKAFVDSGQDIFLYTYYDSEKNYVPGAGTSRTLSIIRKLDKFDTYNQQGMGKVLKVDLDYSEMLKEVTNEKIDGHLYVRNKDLVLFSNKPGTSSMREYEPASVIKTDDATLSMTFQTGFQEWEILIMANDVPFWSVLTSNRWIIPMVLFNLFIPTILIYFVGKSISKRLLLITHYMGKVEKEQFEPIDINEGEDEIGKLIRRYNMMVMRIKVLIEVVFKGQADKQALELAKKSAELKALQSQVNPHFLFNTLETIRMRSLIKGENETADIIGELAILFRKTMSWGKDYISVGEEMAFIDNYIQIQRYRFGDKIKYYHYVMDECYDCIIPKLSISTFVENACIHGIETTDKEGVISVTVTKNQDSLMIEVSDNGKGIDEERLIKLRKMIDNADSSMLVQSDSTGILNSFLRLKTYSDNNVNLDIDSEFGSGTDILIQLPLIYISKEEPIDD